MDAQLIAIATPIFVVAMIVEWLLNRRYQRRSGETSPTGGVGGYRVDDTLTDLATGLGQQALDPLLRLVGVAVYVAVQQRAVAVLPALPSWDVTSPLDWAIVILLVDLGFYWFHRASHRVRLFWAVHHVHHSSDEYNLAVALRQPWLERLFDIPFYLPLAVLGVPVELYLGAFTLDLIYQFFIHARWAPRLGPLEWVLNTPSHHRVHHGVNPAYIDTNYGGILIVWDRLFGTFAPESEPVVYGTVTPLRSWNTWTVNAAPLVELWRASGKAARWQDKLHVWLGGPEWRPADQGGALTIGPPDLRERGWPEQLVPAARLFAIVALLSLSALMSVFQQLEKTLHLQHLAGFALGAVLLMAAWGAALESRRWARPVALLSVVGLGIGWPLWVGWQGVLLAASVGVSTVLLVLAARIRPAVVASH